MVIKIDRFFTLRQREGHTRRRLLFIKRQCDQFPPTAYITAGVVTQVKYHGKKRVLKWHSHTEKFIDEKDIDSANMYVQRSLGNENLEPFGPFQVIIPSLLCIGRLEPEIEVEIGDEEPLDQTTLYFERFLHKQVGANVFVSAIGKISHLATYIDMGTYKASSASTIASIYPCIRYARHEKRLPLQQLVFGLMFENFGNNWKTGNRYYHRKGLDIIRAGGVSEITEEQLAKAHPLDVIRIKSDENKNKLLGKPNQRYFGLFVCVGAKLFVVDNCMEEPKKSAETPAGARRVPHNRSLIQQGGMVFIETDVLSFCEDFIDSRVYNPLITHEAFFDTMVLVHPGSNNTTLKDQIRNFRNPIIFLGAVNSAFNTIAWSVHLSYKKSCAGNFFGKHYVQPPEGGRIVAIADGLDGIREIQQRVCYEMLHDSVLTEHNTEFRIFDPNIVTNILNVNDWRSFEQTYQHIRTPTETNYPTLGRQGTPIRQPVPLFKEFNFRTLTDYDVNFNCLRRNTRLPVPPMYPPLLIEGEIKYIPNRDMRQPVENSYPKGEAINPWSLDPDKQLYTFKRDVQKDTIFGNILDDTITDHDWFRIPFHTPLADVDGINLRIGVDGWVWHKNIFGKQRFTFNSIAYYQVGLGPDPNPLDAIPPGDDPLDAIPPGDDPLDAIPPGDDPLDAIPPGDDPLDAIPPGDNPLDAIPPGDNPLDAIPPGGGPSGRGQGGHGRGQSSQGSDQSPRKKRKH